MGSEYFVDSLISTFILVLKNDQTKQKPTSLSDLSISILSCLLTQSILEKIEAIKHILLKASPPPLLLIWRFLFLQISEFGTLLEQNVKFISQACLEKADT